MPASAVPSTVREENCATVSGADVQKTLSAIRQSGPFRSSKQIQMLLEFLVSETLAGNAETLKERVIGAKLFGRRPDYDTNSDPIVRLRVAELRKRLALYYQLANEEAVRISIPLGAFRVVFDGAHPGVAPSVRASLQEQEPSQSLLERTTSPVQNEAQAIDLKPSSSRLRSRRWWIIMAASLAIATIATLRYLPSSEERAFNKFWSPILENSNTVLIGMGNNPLYELSNAGEDEYYKNHPKSQFEEMGLHPYIPLSPGTPIDGKYINPATDIYLTIGDAIALSNIEYVLAPRKIKLDVRFVNDVTYGDLRQSPTILIGVHNNIWTLKMMENLRFRFQGHSAIVDHADPQKQWTANSDRSETYAIVARILNTWNGKVVFVIGGVGYSGTRAAGDFISNPDAIFKMVKSLPKGWETKNVEVVLHTTVKNQIPSTPEVVATYCW